MRVHVYVYTYIYIRIHIHMGNKDLDLHHQQKRQQSPAFCLLGYCSSKLNFNFDLNREHLKISSTPIRKKKTLNFGFPHQL